LFLAKVLTDAAAGATYDTPFEVPGVTEIGITRNNSNQSIYADDIAYETVQQQGDIDIAVSLAGLSAEKRAEVTGGSYSSSTGAVEYDGSVVPEQYALGYRRQKANGEYRFHWFMKGSFTRPDSTATTKSGSVSPQAMQYSYRALNRIYDDLLERSVDSDDENLPTGLTAALLNSAATGWFSTPEYTPVAPGTAISDLAASTGSGASGSVDLTFSAPTGAESVRMQVETPGGDWEYIDTDAALTAASTSATVSGLTASNTYNFRLVVAGGASNGISNEDDAAAKA